MAGACTNRLMSPTRINFVTELPRRTRTKMEQRDEAAYKVLRAQYNFLKMTLQGSRRELLDECFSKGLVSMEMKDEIDSIEVQRSPAQRCALLLDTLMKNGNEGVFQQFVQILRSIPTAEYLAKSLQEEYVAQQQHQPQLDSMTSKTSAEYEGPTEMMQPIPALTLEDLDLVFVEMRDWADSDTQSENTDEKSAPEETEPPTCVSPESQLLDTFLKCNHDEALQLLSTRGCDPAVIKDDSGKSLLHLACRFDHEWLDIVKSLIENHHCDPNAKDHSGNTPLHDACRHRSCTTIEYLLSKQPCDPNAQNAEENTPLHIACINGFKDVVHVLLSSGVVVPHPMNKYKETPSQLTDNEDIRAILSSFAECIVDPFVPSVKVFMVGSYSNNRTSIVQEILEKVGKTEEKERYRSFIEKSEGRMSGIIPLPFHTKELGPVLLYDVRHSSSSLLKMIPPGGSCVFLVGINLAESDFKISKSDSEITECLQEWLAKITNCSATTSNCLIVIGNNPELDPVCLNEKTILVERVCKGSSVKYAGCAPIRSDVALSFNNIHELYSYLGESILALKSSPALNYSHHLLHHLLQRSFADRGYCTISQIASWIEKERIIPLAHDPSHLNSLLSLLCDEGALLLLLNTSEIKESWVILDSLKLLEDIASMYISYQQQKHTSEFWESTKIAIHQFSKIFPTYNPVLVAELLTSLQFIHEITDVEHLQSLTTDHPYFVQYYCFHCTEEEHSDVSFSGAIAQEEETQLDLSQSATGDTTHDIDRVPSGSYARAINVGLQGVPKQAKSEHFSVVVEETSRGVSGGQSMLHGHKDEESPPVVPQRQSTEFRPSSEHEREQDYIIKRKRTSWCDDHEEMIFRICILLLLVVLVMLVIPIPFVICFFCYRYHCCCYNHDCCYHCYYKPRKTVVLENWIQPNEYMVARSLAPQHHPGVYNVMLAVPRLCSSTMMTSGTALAELETAPFSSTMANDT